MPSCDEKLYQVRFHTMTASEGNSCNPHLIFSVLPTSAFLNPLPDSGSLQHVLQPMNN